tara:strand:+ start:881 stop:1354 length:474 start_codon:yes stop_codon:yes gene_type:complete
MNKEENVRPNYYTQHLTNRAGFTVIPKFDLQKGMVFQNRYKSRDGKTRDYMFLVLNPLYRIDMKVHVLSLNEMTKIQFNNLARRTGVRVIPKYKKTRALTIPKLIMHESSRRFYHKILAPKMDVWYNNGYRTLTLGNIGTVILIDYKFDEDIEISVL